MNSGLEDVVNLAWKLTGVLEGWAGARLLQSYGEERRPVFVETGEAIAGGIAADRAFLEQYSPEQDEMRFAEAWRQLGRVAGERQRAYEPHYEGSPVVAGPPDAVCGIRGQHSLRARAGHHLAPVSLSSGRNVFEELGAGFSLLALDVDDAAAMAFQRAASSLGVPLRVLRDTYTAGRTCLGRHLVLIRPDQYVAWAGDLAPVDPTALIRKVTGT